uniref:hypothetical protein n=1 Tax=Stenotrophomonas pavanii TaxID=487698 RepID=UPI001BE036C4|nr:hypothetical protein [Stenotrophomonas pavanii]
MADISPQAPLPPREDQVTGCGASPSSGSSACFGQARWVRDKTGVNMLRHDGDDGPIMAANVR